jgi:CBS domain-containing protein
MPRDLPVTAIMTTDVVTLRLDMGVEDAVRLLADRGFSGAPVVDDEGRLVGLLDDSDIILSEARLHAPTVIELFGAYVTWPGESRRYAEELRHALGGTVGEVMDDDPPSLTATATVEDVATALVRHDVSRLPIVDDDRRVIGIVTRGDLVQAIGRRPDEA